MASKGRLKEFDRWPKYLENYKRAVARFLPGYLERAKARGTEPQFTTPEQMIEWWIYGEDDKPSKGQLYFEEFCEEEEE